MTIENILKKNPRISLTEKELLIAHALRHDRGFVLAHPEYRLSFAECVRFRYYQFLRERGYSYARITGHKDFYGLDFIVNRHTLIPRPETESMVDLALDLVTQLGSNGQSYILADIGTGSGCIPISIIQKALYAPQAAYATDIARGALRTARVNALRHGAHIIFSRGNLLQPIARALNKSGDALILTANLPYLTAKQFAEEFSIQKEPYTALVAEENGLALYRELLAQLKNALKEKRRDTYVFFEIDPAQAETLPKMIKNYFPPSNPDVTTDTCGRPRIVSARLFEQDT